jgi:prevent-host-death family protein
MTTIGIRALKQNASKMIRQAAAGNAITITDRGKPVARIVLADQQITDRLRLSETLDKRRNDERYSLVARHINTSAVVKLVTVEARQRHSS